MTEICLSNIIHCIFFFFFINNFILFFHTQHNIISKIQQNKTKQNKTKQNQTTDTYSTSQGPIKREGEREGQQEHKSHSFIQSRTVCPTKNTAKHQWSKAWPHQLAPLYIHMTLFAGGYGSNMFFYTCVV